MAIVYMGSDHAGFGMRAMLAQELAQKGHDIRDLGPERPESCDYPVFAEKVCEKVLAEPGSFGILICGTGIGMSMAANRFRGIRAALCACEFQARATRQHNNANVLCLGERVTGPSVALEIAGLFLDTAFEGGRHQRRIDLFDATGRHAE